MSEFAEIPPPIYEQIALCNTGNNGSRTAEGEEALAAKYLYYDDRAAPENPKEP
jgi:hypothetical protein